MPIWARIAAGIAAVALLALVCFAMGKLLLGALNLLHTDGGPTSADPMFAEEAERVTRPPELSDEGVGLGREATDPSSAWVEENQTPVDATAEELAREEESGSAQ